MAGTSNYLENARLSWVKGTTHPAAPANTYVALFTAAPTDAGGGTEVTTVSTAYARQAIASSAWSTVGGGGASPESISNSNAVTFAQATANYGTVVAVGVYDAVTAGNLLYWNTITSTVVNSGNTFSIAAGALTITED